MKKQFRGPRKQRTRQHVIAAQSLNYVERFIIDEGHTAQRFEQDYGYDLIVFTYDSNGYVEEGALYLQLKASESLSAIGDGFVFDLDIRDYHRWKSEPMPVILILFDAGKRRAFWLYVQQYFAEDELRRPGRGVKTVRVHVPARQSVNRRAIVRWRDFKRAILDQLEGVSHG
ncbi:MAG: DUF4365 domain-containing protein [Gemmataceae bacterium]|nr:DUF4365 domain-containing protein [Gemmataceae bacterium]MCI0743330.1 DUF4365 domain-containing protein [Gemmataceae bacterium]